MCISYSKQLEDLNTEKTLMPEEDLFKYLEIVKTTTKARDN